jgi:ribonuclease P protein component
LLYGKVFLWRQPALRPLEVDAALFFGARARRLQRSCVMFDSMPNPPDLSFPKARRLEKPEEFARVKGQGTTQRGPTLLLGVLANKEEKLFRAGFVTSKRIGGAVVRNRVRRRLRDIVRTQQARLRKGVWFVVVARPAAARATYGALKDEWLRLAERASILAP